MLGSLIAVALAQAPVVLPAGAPASFSAASVPWPILADAGFAAAHDGLGFRLVWVDARRVLGDGTQAEVWSARPDGAEAAMLFETNMGEGVSNLQLVGLGDGGVVVGTEVRSVGNAVVQFRVRSGGLSSVVAPAVQPNTTALVRLADGGLTGGWLTGAGVAFRSGPLPSLPVMSALAGTFTDGPALGGQGAAAVWAANGVGNTIRRGIVGAPGGNGNVLGQVIAVTDAPAPVPSATLVWNAMGLYNDDWPTMLLRTDVSPLPRPVAALVGDRVVVLYRTVTTPMMNLSVSFDPAGQNSLIEGEVPPVHPRLLAGSRDGGLAVEWGPLLGFRSYPVTLDATSRPTFGAPLRLPPQPAPQRRPSVVWGGGRFFVAWDQFTLTSDWQAFVSSIDPLGTAGSVSAVGLLGGPPNDPQLVQNPAGTVELFSIGTPGSRRGVSLVNGTVVVQPATPTADDTSGGVVVGQNTTLAWSRTALTVGGVNQMLVGPPPTCVSRVGGEFRYFSRGSTGDLVLVVIPDVAVSPMRAEVAAVPVAQTPGPVCTTARELPDGGAVLAGVWANAQVTSLVVREGLGPLSVSQLPGVSTVEAPRVVPFAGGWLVTGQTRRQPLAWLCTDQAVCDPLPLSLMSVEVGHVVVAAAPDERTAAIVWREYDGTKTGIRARVVADRRPIPPPMRDGGADDGGALDAGSPDSGAPEPDGGLRDAGLEDGGADGGRDAGLPVDAGLDDAGFEEDGGSRGPDAGRVTLDSDAGLPLLVFVPTGCGCDQSSAGLASLVGLLVLVTRRARRG